MSETKGSGIRDRRKPQPQPLTPHCSLLIAHCSLLVRGATMNLDIDTSIRFADGEEAGRIARVVLEPDGKTVQSVVMTTSELVSRDVVVPADRLTMVDGDVIQ